MVIKTLLRHQDPCVGVLSVRPLCLFFVPFFSLLEAPLKGNCIFHEAGLLQCFPLVEGKRKAATDTHRDRQAGRQADTHTNMNL